jgi:hypothetical protein
MPLLKPKLRPDDAQVMPAPTDSTAKDTREPRPDARQYGTGPTRRRAMLKSVFCWYYEYSGCSKACRRSRTEDMLLLPVTHREL